VIPVTLPARPLDSPIRHNLFLAFKEALNNVVKHSGAGSVFITLQLPREGFRLTVTRP
jgi:signal transduction histidine kinase